MLLAGRGLQLVFSIVSIKLTTTLLGPTEIGRMNLILAVSTWFGLLLISPVGNFVFRQALEWNLEGRLLSSLKRYVYFLSAVAIIEVFILVILNSTTGIGTAIQLGWLVWLIVGTLLLGGLSITFTTIINTLGYRILFVLFVNLSSWLGLFLAVGLGERMGFTAENWMSGLIIGQIIVLIFSSIALFRISRRSSLDIVQQPKTSGFEILPVFRFSWPLIIATAFYWIQISGYRFVLVSISDETNVGLFAAGIALAVSPLIMFENLFTEYYRPIFYREIAYSDNQQKAQAWNRYASAYFPALILVGVFLGFSGPLLADILVSSEFQQVSWLAFFGAIIQSALMVYATYVFLVFASLDTKVLIWPNIFGAGVALIGLFILAPHNPLLGTGIALSLGMVITMLDCARRLRNTFALILPWKRLLISTILALPLGVGLLLYTRVYQDPYLFQSLLGLAIAGLYLAGCEYLLAREWLFSNDKHPTSVQYSNSLPQIDS